MGLLDFIGIGNMFSVSGPVKVALVLFGVGSVLFGAGYALWPVVKLTGREIKATNDEKEEELVDLAAAIHVPYYDDETVSTEDADPIEPVTQDDDDTSTDTF